jgi:hypothetical protein
VDEFVIVTTTGSPLRFGDPTPPGLPVYSGRDVVKIASAMRRDMTKMDAATTVTVNIQIIDLSTGKLSNVVHFATNVVFITSDISNTSCGQ